MKNFFCKGTKLGRYYIYPQSESCELMTEFCTYFKKFSTNWTSKVSLSISIELFLWAQNSQICLIWQVFKKAQHFQTIVMRPPIIPQIFEILQNLFHMYSENLFLFLKFVTLVGCPDSTRILLLCWSVPMLHPSSL